MKILVTGADGFTGCHFIPLAKSAGHEVVSLKSDLCDLAALKDEISLIRPAAVVHLAGISFVDHADINQFYNVNVIGTLNLLESLAQSRSSIQKILLASSANVYGNCKHSPISENDSVSPVNHYAMSKLSMEYMARTYLDRLPIFFTRPFNYTGPGQSISFIIPKIVYHFVNKKDHIELGNIDVEREFNDVRFVCEIYLRLLDCATTGEVYNICAGNYISINSVLNILRKISQHDLEVRINKKFVRINEIKRLSGDCTKLFNTIGQLMSPSFINTLNWMYENSEQQ